SRLTLVSQREQGPPPVVESFPDDPAEAEGIAERIQALIEDGRPAADVAILFRTNGQSEAFEQALTSRGIGYLVRGGDRFFERQEVRRAMVSLRAATRVEQIEPGRAVRDVLSQQGWNPQPPATTGAVRERWDSLNALVGLADTVLARPGTGLAEVVRELEERAEAQSAPVVDGVTLASVHAAKGLEWPVVHVGGAGDGLAPVAPTEPTGAPARRTGRRTATRYSACRVREQALVTTRDQKIGRHAGCPPSADGAVLEQLRTWRRERARRSGAPAYTVFTDATLEAIAERDPRSPSELQAVPGVGPAKVESYGHEVLELLGSHRSRTAESG